MDRLPLVVVDLFWVSDPKLSELQDHLGTFPNGLVEAFAAGQEVWVLLRKVWVVENKRLCRRWKNKKVLAQRLILTVIIYRLKLLLATSFDYLKF